MDTLSLRNALRTVQDVLFKISYHLGRPLNDPAFFDITPKEDTHDAIVKTHSLVTKLGNKFQESVHKTLSDKNIKGDFVPKPTGKFVGAIAIEGMTVLNKSLPYISRITTPQTLLYTAFSGATLVMLSDDTAKNVIMDGFGQLTSAFQAKSNPSSALNEIKPPENNIV